jgi:hypothetical protein
LKNEPRRDEGHEGKRVLEIFSVSLDSQLPTLHSSPIPTRGPKIVKYRKSHHVASKSCPEQLHPTNAKPQLKIPL